MSPILSGTYTIQNGSTSMYASIQDSNDGTPVTATTTVNAKSTWTLTLNNVDKTYTLVNQGSSTYAWVDSGPTQGVSVTSGGVSTKWKIKDAPTSGQYLIETNDNTALYWNFASSAEGTEATLDKNLNLKSSQWILAPVSPTRQPVLTGPYNIQNGGTSMYASIQDSNSGTSVTATTVSNAKAKWTVTFNSVDSTYTFVNQGSSTYAWVDSSPTQGVSVVSAGQSTKWKIKNAATAGQYVIETNDNTALYWNFAVSTEGTEAQLDKNSNLKNSQWIFVPL